MTEPLNYPNPTRCPTCGGHGDQECSHCLGQGCFNCDGTGDVPCPTCEGVGVKNEVRTPIHGP